MLKLSAIVMVLVPAMALAQQPQAVTAPGPAATPLAVTNDCTHLFPQSAALAGEEGSTIVSVTIAADGTVKDPHVGQSSGYDDLDNAALACVNGGHVKPLTSRGVPIEAATQIEVVWRRSTFNGAPASIGQDICPYNYYPPLAVRLNHQGDVELSYTIAEDGNAKNVMVTKSSGYDELDKAAVACVSRFRHWPVTRQGHGVEVDEQVRIAWRQSFGRSPPLVPGNKS